MTTKAKADRLITNISISNIIADPNQPRRFFDESELSHLAESIKQYGVTSPILVRPIEGGTKYMIVFGERRYRARQLAGLEKIPCMVRELNDDDAFELQITENLQRHDPHPMEEAAAFLKMKSRYSFAEMVERIGRSKQYVAKRLLLNDLLPDFQEMFFKGILDMKEALCLAKVSKESQEVILEERCEGWKTNSRFSLNNVDWWVRDYEHDLTKAQFDIEDTSLVVASGACATCVHNSANKLTLFLEDKTNICNNGVCYSMKTENAFRRKLEDAVKNPDVVLIDIAYSHDSKDEQRLKMAEELGVSVLTEKSFDRIFDYGEDKKPVFDTEYIEDNIGSKPNLEEYLAEQKEDSPNWEYNAEVFEAECKVGFKELEQKYEEDLKELEKEFNSDVAKWEANQKKYAEDKANGHVKRGFVVAGYSSGEIVYIRLKSSAVSDASAGGTSQAIIDIKLREERAQELDGEKIWEQVRKYTTEDPEEKFKSGGDLTSIEYNAVGVALYECLGWSKKSQFMEEVLGMDMYKDSKKDIAARLLNLSSSERHILVRMLVKQNLYKSGSGHDNSISNIAGFTVAKEYYPEQVDETMATIEEKANKRSARVHERIEAMNKSND